MAARKSSCYCINLRRAANAATALYDKALMPVGLTVNQFSLLSSMMSLESCSVSTLASYVGLERTTLTRTLKPLIDRGFIQDASGIGTRRRALHLTDKGKAALDAGFVFWEEAQRKIEASLGKAEAKWIYRLAEKL